MDDNIIKLHLRNGRKQVWTFPDGTIVTIEVPTTEPPITVAHAVYCLSSLVHSTHSMMMMS
jgi:hypothetical protein